MSRDVAKLIYDMSCAKDTSYWAEKLKEKYIKQRPPDEDLMIQLYTTIAKYIKEHNNITYVVLFKVNSPPGYTFKTFTTHSKDDKIDELSLRYSFVSNDNIFVIHDVETRRLIDEAIIPLDLRWRGRKLVRDHMPDVYSIVVSWDHWKNNKK